MSLSKFTGHWGNVRPPAAPRHAHKIQQQGRERIDPYAWMKFIPESGTRVLDGLPAPLREHLAAEMQYAQEILRPLASDIEWFRDRMARRAAAINEPAINRPGGWRYDSKCPAGMTHRVFSRSRADGQTQFLFDEAGRAQPHAYYRATDHQPSPDDRYFVWAEDVVGDDRHRICLLDMDNGVVRTVVAADAFGYGAFTFSQSSRYLFWIWRDAHSRPTRLYRSAVDGGAAVLVYEEHDPAVFMRVSRTAVGGFISLELAGPDVSEVRLIAADAETDFPQIVRARQRGVRYQIYEWNDTLLMLTNADGAIDGKLLSLHPQTFAIQGELVPHRVGVSIISVQAFADALVRLERIKGLPYLILMYPDGREIPVGFDDPAYCIDLTPAQSYEAHQVRIVHQTPASPPRWIDISFSSGRCEVVGQVESVDLDPAAYRVERIYARASDGVTIPITVLSRKDADVNQPQPLLLTGYGAYGVASEPRYSLPATVLVDAGFRYAIAHVRGGSEKGRRWYQDACREKKRNSMTDFIACARHLVSIGHAAPGRIVAHGVSAGGLLVCGAMNLDPGLWAGVIAQVPFVDMLNTMSDASHPLVPLFRPDWGDPLSDPDAYDYIAAISPYENVQQAAYPPVLCTAGLKDDRVPYWEPAKLLANIRYQSTGDSPSILMLNPDSGHQESDDQNTLFAQAAMLWAFACKCSAVAPGTCSEVP